MRPVSILLKKSQIRPRFLIFKQFAPTAVYSAPIMMRIILDRDDLTVTEVKTQKELKKLQGHDIRLDIYATDRSGVKYDIEVQRADKGAHRKRARYHSSMVDASMLKSGENFTELKESIEHAQRMIIDGTLPLEKIAEYTGLPIEKVRELANKKSA